MRVQAQIIHQCEAAFVKIDTWLFEFYVLATFKVTSEWVVTNDIVHSWRLYCLAPLGTDIPLNHIILTLSQPVLFPILAIPTCWLGRNKYQIWKALLWFHGNWTPELAHRKHTFYRLGHHVQLNVHLMHASCNMHQYAALVEPKRIALLWDWLIIPVSNGQGSAACRQRITEA